MFQSLLAAHMITRSLERRQYGDRPQRRATATAPTPRPAAVPSPALAPSPRPAAARHRWRQLLDDRHPASA